jgi:hypothetical protein
VVLVLGFRLSLMENVPCGLFPLIKDLVLGGNLVVQCTIIGCGDPLRI